jgi:holo-[acyl-carrier protein] synthase
LDILGIGSEIVECVRIGRLLEQHGEAFLARVFTELEQRECQSRLRPIEHFAARWAAKESVLRALGLGRGPGIARTTVEVRVGDGRRPEVQLRGPTDDEAVARGVGEVLVSMAHCRAYATAHALALPRRAAPPVREVRGS